MLNIPQQRKIAGDPIVKDMPAFMEGAKIGFDDPMVAAGQLGEAAGLRAEDFLSSQRAAEGRISEYEARRAAAGESGVDWGRVAGNIANPIGWIPGMGIGRAATYGGRVLQGAKIGAATAPLVTPASPGAEGMDFAAEKSAQMGAGAVWGAILPGVGEPAGRYARNIFGPITDRGATRAAGRLAGEAAEYGGKRDEVISALRTSRPAVPGAAQTAGQASVPSGSAEFAALQNITDEFHPTPAMEVQKGQREGRIAAIKSVGKDKPTLKRAQEARDIAGEADYSDAFTQLDRKGNIVPRMVKSDPVLENMLGRPSMEKVVGRAQSLAAERDKPFQIGVTAPAGEKTDMIGALSGGPYRTATKATLAKYPAESLHFLKLAMDDIIKDPKTFGVGSTERAGIIATQKQFIGWLEGRVPQYGTARTNFAAASRGISQMKLGQQFEQELTNPLGTGEPAARFANVMRNPLPATKKATGGPRYDDYSRILSPGQKQAVDNVLKDLETNAEFKELAGAGMAASRKLTGARLNPEDAPRVMTRIVVIFNNVINRIEGKGAKKTMAAMSRLMNGDPREMARVMESAQPFEKRAIYDAALRIQAMGAGAIAGQSTGTD